jgi:hypothetical protein
MLAELEYPPELRLREFGRVVGTPLSNSVRDFLRSSPKGSFGSWLKPQWKEVPMNYTPQELREFIRQLTNLVNYFDHILYTEMEHFLITDCDIEVNGDYVDSDLQNPQQLREYRSELPPKERYN